MLCNNVAVRRRLYFELGLPVFLFAHFPFWDWFATWVCRLPFAVWTWLNWRPTRNGRLACQVVSSLVLFQSSAAILDHVKSPVKLSGFKTNRAWQRSRKSEVGSRKLEMGSRKSEVGSKKWEVGGPKSYHAALSLNGNTSEIRSSNFVKSEHDGRLLGLFLPQLRKFNFWLTEQYFIFQMKQDIKTS